MVISISSSRKLDVFSSGALSGICSGPLDEYTAPLEELEGVVPTEGKRQIDVTPTETLLSLKTQSCWSKVMNMCFCACCCLIIFFMLSVAAVSDDTEETSLSEAIENEHEELRTSGGNICDWSLMDTPTPIFEVFAQGFYARGNITAGDYLIKGVMCVEEFPILLVVSSVMKEVFLLRRDLVRVRFVGPQPALSVLALSRPCHLFNDSLPLAPFTIPGSATTWALVDSTESDFQIQALGDATTCWSVDECDKGVGLDACEEGSFAQRLSVRDALLQTKAGCSATFRGLLVTTWCEA